MGLLDRIAPRRPEADPPPDPAAAVGDPVFATKALRKFLTSLTANASPALLDLGPVVGSNVSFFGEQLGCKIFRDGKVDRLPDFLRGRFPQATGSVDGVLCWDLIDYLDKLSAQAVAAELTRVLRPEGVLLGFFGAQQTIQARYTKYIIVDEVTLKHRTYPAARGRQTTLLNRDIIKLFGGLRVSDSFLLKTNIREILFRKPA